MTLIIWRFSDGKPGHDSQSIGLCNAIEKLKPVKRFDILAAPKTSNLRNFLYKSFSPGKDLPKPDLIVGAGHRTHLSMLTARHARKGKIVVLMKPSLPTAFFDFCLIPKHDHIADKNNVIRTAGALNPIQFNKNKTPDTGLILLGGISKHCHWDNKSVIDQINAIVANNPDIKWTIADSPRTPKSVLGDVNIRSCKNATILSFSETSSIEIQRLIFNSSYIWVSRDSISMIYESLSSGAAVGLIDLPQKKDNRLHKGINDLVNEGYLTICSTKNTKPALKSNMATFNEAQRCAELLLSRGIFG
jgi:uncharacterized protein